MKNSSELINYDETNLKTVGVANTLPLLTNYLIDIKFLPTVRAIKCQSGEDFKGDSLCPLPLEMYHLTLTERGKTAGKTTHCGHR